LVCCWAFTSDASSAFSIIGTSNVDGGGSLALMVPADAPLGEQTIDVTCTGLTGSALINVSAPPVVTDIDSMVYTNATLTITGENLGLVTNVDLADGEVVRYCEITNQTDTSIECIPTYTGTYWPVLTQENCDIVTDETKQVNVQLNL
jgi:hypothetical protein